MDNRYEVLQELIDFEQPLDVISSKLKGFNFDFDGEPLVLSKEKVIAAINSFITGKKNADELERWANLIEMREDIDFEGICEDSINDVIYKLANPILEEPITTVSCKKYLALLC